MIEGLGRIVLWRDPFGRRLELRLMALMALERLGPPNLVSFARNLRARKRFLFLPETKKILRAVDAILARAGKSGG